MWRVASDSNRGLTLIEMLVALVASAILITGLVRFSRDFHRNYNVQEDVADRDLNAHYTVKRMSEAFQAAGADLPSQGWAMINLPDGNPGPHLVLSVNPHGGVQYLATPLNNGMQVPVDDGKGFAKATAVLAVPQSTGSSVTKVLIDQGYNGNGFVKGVLAAGNGAVLRLVSPLTLNQGDAVYAYAEDDYRLINGTLTLNGSVLAEDIQDLKFTVFAANQSVTSQWSAMRSARIEVTARTRTPDPGYKPNQGYRTLDLAMDVLLRNRL